jgi:hypothetical protein
MGDYYGKITSDVYAAALRLRGDDECCWEEKVPLADPPLVFGPEWPEEFDGDEIIAIWETALADARQEYGDGRFTLKSVTMYLIDNQGLPDFVWEPNVHAMDAHPDFAKKLVSQGWQKDSEFTFLPLELLNLGRLDNGAYSTMASIDYAGRPHAVSIDFDDESFEDLLGCLPVRVAAEIRKYFQEHEGPTGLRFATHLPVVICAKLGVEVQNDLESYIPWVATRVSPYPD